MGRRRIDTPPQRLLEEARSIEVLLSDISPGPEDVEAYWQLSADMINLMIEIEALAAAIGVTTDDPLFLRLRRELSRIESDAIEISRKAEKEP